MAESTAIINVWLLPNTPPHPSPIHLIRALPLSLQAAMALEACVRFSSEARRLQPQADGDALAHQFDVLHAALERICA